MKHHFLNITLSSTVEQTRKWLNYAFSCIIFIAALAPTVNEASTCSSATSNVTFNGLDKNLIFSASGQDFPSVISYIGSNGSNVWNINVKGSSADFDPKTRDISTINVSGAPWENPVWPNANGIWFDGIYPDELMDFEFTLTRVSGTDPLDLFMHTGESLDDEIDTLTTTGSNWILGQYGNMTETPNITGKTAVFEDNGLAEGNDTGVGYWEMSTSFSGNSGTITWNYDYTDSDMAYRGTNMLAFETKGVCSSSVTDLTCSPGYQLESWPASSSGGNTFDSTNNLLRLTASKNFTNSTHPGIAGIRTSTSNGEQTESLSLNYLDSSVADVESFRILVYDLDSETANDQDYAYISTGGSNLAAYSIGSNVEKHPSIPNAYRAVLLSGGGSGADEPYHAGFVDVGVATNTSYTLASGYTGSGSESFVGYQACVSITPPSSASCDASTGVEIIADTGLDSTTGTGWNDWAVTSSGTDTANTWRSDRRGGYAVVWQDDGEANLAQTGLSGWNSGISNNGGARIEIDFFWADADFDLGPADLGPSNTSVLDVMVDGVIYATVTTPPGATPGQSASISYSNGASGNLSTMISPGASVHVGSTTSPTNWQIELPTSAPATGDLKLRAKPDGYPSDDFYIDAISAIVCPGASTTPTTANISGTIFEDVNYGGGAGRDYATANTSFSSLDVGTEATVELWESDGSICTGAAPLQTTTSNAVDGSYSFNSITGANFCIKVVNNSVQSNRTRVNWTNTPLPVQTFRSDATDGTSTVTAITNEIGGRSPIDTDVAAGNFDSTSGDGSIAQSWSVVNISGGNVSDIDFGFNFDTIVNANDAGQGSLRQFIINANTLGDEASLTQSGQTAGREVSVFMLPNGSNYAGMSSTANVFSGGAATIDVQSELPDIIRSRVDIDALTQAGASCSRPIVELNGASAGTTASNSSSQLLGASGLTIRRSDHYIRGLIINRFSAAGIELARGGYGSFSGGNVVFVQQGYPSANDRSDDTHIECNWLGLDKTGTAAQGNGEVGIFMWGHNSFVGNGSASGRNVISGNGEDGIMIGGGGSLNNIIQGNYIGTDAAGTGAVGNGRHGIVYSNTDGAITGRQSLIQDNTIAYNGGAGIGLARTTPAPKNIRITQNRIFSNAELGIDLNSTAPSRTSDGVTLNDSQDTDSRWLPNGYQNYPVITSVLQIGTDVDITGTLNSLADTNYEIELYTNQTCNADASGSASTDAYGEGENYLATLYVTTNSSGDGSFTTTLPYASLSGSNLTALASNVTPGDTEEGNTSEFSACTGVTLCTALADEVNAAILAPEQLLPGKRVFIAASSINNGSRQGHLRAYEVLSDGSLDTSVDWDAATTMTKSERSNRLYSTNVSGTLVLFDELVNETDENTAFNLGAVPDKTTVTDFTLDPSADSGVYLDDRASNSFLGTISPHSSLTQISRNMDVWSYLNDSNYRSFYNDTVKVRTERILVTSDDGFLYSFNQSDGDLAWGWMPRSLVYHLTRFQSFRDASYMQGHIDVLDLKSGSSFDTYVIGSYKSGLGQFVLKLDKNSTSKSDLAAVIWDVDETQVNSLADNSPNLGKRAYFSDAAGKVYAAYVITAGGTSYLKIRSLTDDSVTESIPLNYLATSTPYIMTDFNASAAPAPKTLYLGDSGGNIYAAALFNTDGALKSSTNIGTALNSTSVAQMNSASTTPVQYIGASLSYDGGYYLRAQTRDRITVFRYLSSQWKRQWTATVGAAGKWATDGAYAADNAIEQLPTSALINDPAAIVADSIVLPVSTPPSGSNCYRNAYYYLYRLADGHFPTGRLYDGSDGSAITTIVGLGRGTPLALKLSDASNGKMMGFGLSDQKSDGSTGINKKITIKDDITTGIRSWRELRD